MPILILICFSFLFGGCTWIDCEGHYTYVPEDFTEEEQSWIEEGASRWNEWVGYTLVTVAPGKRDTCTIYNGKTKKPTAIGETAHPYERIVVDKEDLINSDHLDRNHFEAVVMHELGHSFGFHHNGENGTALMAPSGSDDFTDIDRNQCFKIGICKTRDSE
jgi:hypothetical protein